MFYTVYYIRLFLVILVIIWKVKCNKIFPDTCTHVIYTEEIKIPVIPPVQN